MHSRIIACDNVDLHPLSNTTPTFVSIFITMLIKAEDATVELITKKINRGDYLRTKRALLAQALTELAGESQRIVVGLERDLLKYLTKFSPAARVCVRRN